MNNLKITINQTKTEIILKRASLIFSILLFFGINSNGQQQYIAECYLSTRYWDQGICPRNYNFRNLRLFSTNGLLFYYPDNYNNTEIFYRVVNNLSYLSLVIDGSQLSRGNNDQLNVYINGARSYDGQNYLGLRERGACVFMGMLTFQVNTYDAVTINELTLHNCTSCSPSVFCVNNINDNLKFKLSAQNPGNASLTLLVYLDGQPIKEHYLGSYSDSINVRFSDLGLQNHFEKQIQFVIRSILGGVAIYSNTINTKFFSQIPEPRSLKVRQRACDPKLSIDLTLDPSIIANISKYKFRACKEGDEGTSNPYVLTRVGEPVDNKITLLPNDPSSYSKGEYTLQIYQDVSDLEPEKMNSVKCARNWPFSVDSLLKPLSITHSLKSYTFNNQTYHVTRNGASDGEATLTLTDGTSNRVGRFEYFINNSWQQIPANQLTNLDNKTYRFSGLQAGNYQVRAVDIDGCESNTIPFTIVQPNPLTFNQVNTDLVSCHTNNTGSQADGRIRADFTGGIGPYQVVVYNSSNSRVYSNNNIQSLSFQTDLNLTAGRYSINLTDRFGTSSQTTTSLNSNPELRLTYTATPYTCSGTNDGAILLKAVNKVTNYIDFTLTGQSGIHTITDSALYKNLLTGNYNAIVTNTNGCSARVNNIAITGPRPIVISGTVTNPVCHNSNEGTITPTVSGGNGSFNYRWSNGRTTRVLNGLNNGNYTLTVRDAKGCTSENTFYVTPPPVPTAGWAAKTITLCTGNNLLINAGENNQFEWRKDGVLISDKNSYTVWQQGTYTLKVTNTLGCVGVDTFKVNVSDHPLDALLLVQDSAMINETVEAIDVTWPVPDSITWRFDKPVFIGSSNEWSQQFSYDNTGVVNVTLRAWYGGCFSDSTKTVTIYYQDGEIPLKKLEQMPIILGFKAFPNPNDGNFKVQVKLSRKADILLKLYSLQNSNMILSKEYEGMEEYTIPFQLNNLPMGVYVIILKAENEQQSLKVVIGH